MAKIGPRWAGKLDLSEPQWAQPLERWQRLDLGPAFEGNIAGGVAELFDLPRHGPHAGMHQLGGRLAGIPGLRQLSEIGLDIPEGTPQAPAPTLGESWRAVESGGEELRRAGLMQGEGWKQSVAGIGYEIWTDPLNLLGFAGQLTKTGKAAKAGGTLAKTWGAQAKLGQRALLSVWKPGIKAGRITAEWTPIIKGARAVGAMGDFGMATKWRLARLFGRTATESPEVYRRGLQVLEEARHIARDKTVEPLTRFMRLEEGVERLFKDAPQDFREQAIRAAEHAGKAGWRAEEFARYAPEVQELALHYTGYTRQMEKVMREEGLAVGSLGAQLRKMFDHLKGMEADEIDSMRKAFGEELFELGAEQREVFDQVLRFKREAVGAARQADELTKPFRQAVTAGRLAEHQKEIGAQAARVLKQLEPLRAGRFRGAAKELAGILPGVTEGPAAVARWEGKAGPGLAIENVIEAIRRHEPVTQEMFQQLRPHVTKVQYSEIVPELRKLANLEGGIPGVGRRVKGEVMRERGRLLQMAQKADARAAGLKTKLSNLYETEEFWRGTFTPDSAELRAIRRATFEAGKAMDDVPNWVPHALNRKGLQRVLKAHGREFTKRFWDQAGEFQVERQFFEWAKVGNKAVKVPASFDQIARMLDQPVAGTKLVDYSEYAKGGLFEHLRRMFGGQRKVNLRRLYQMDPVESLAEVNRRAMDALYQKNFLEEVLTNPEVVGATARSPYWVPLRQVSSTLADKFGDKFIDPTIAREMRRTYTNSLRPGMLGAVTRAYDSFTRVFKKSVTTPESLVEGLFTGAAKPLERAGLRRVPSLLRKTGRAASWFPAFMAYHLRNAYSDFTLMGYNGAFSPKTVGVDGMRVMAGRSPLYAGELLGNVSPKKLRRMFRGYGVLFGQTLELGAGASRIGVFLEDSRRAGYMLDGLRRGYSPYQAAQRCKRVLFDYSDMSNVEREVARRFVPFWSWLRHNVKLQVEQVFTRPGIQMAQWRIAGKPTSTQDLPPWIRGRLAMSLGRDKQTAEEKLLVGIGLPIEDMTELLDFSGGFRKWVEDAVWRMNPALKAGGPMYSILTGKRKGYEDPRATTRAVAAIIRGAGAEDLVGLRRRKGRDGGIYYTMKAEYEQLFRYVLNRFYTTEKRLESPFLTTQQKMQSMLTGTTIQRFSPEKERRKEAGRRGEARLQELRAVGDIRRSRRGFLYRPRGSRLSEAEFKQALRRAGY